MELYSEMPGNFQLWSSTAAVDQRIYSDISSCILNNGFATKQFNWGRGVRQGCPLSGILFTNGIEILANAIRNTNDIKGIEIDDTNAIKLTQYADDTTVFLTDVQSLNNLLSSKIVLDYESINQNQSCCG